MRMPGIAEIILILIVASIVLVAIRLIGSPAKRKSDKLARIKAEEKGDEERVKKHPRSRIQMVGIIAVVLGVIIFLSSLNLVKWVFWGPVGAIVIVVIGVVTIIAARRR